MSGASAASRGQVRARDDDEVPEHLQCSVCLSAPFGRIEQCTNGEHNDPTDSKMLKTLTSWTPADVVIARGAPPAQKYCALRSCSSRGGHHAPAWKRSSFRSGLTRLS